MTVMATKDEKQIQEALRRPFSVSEIEWRVQRHVVLNNKDYVVVVPYIDARAVMNRLDEVFGIGGWKDEYERWGEKGVKCRLYFRLSPEGEWMYREDGADESATEPTKGGFSDALKRAAVKLGIGRYLYDLDEVMVPLTPEKQFENDRYYVNKDKKVKGYWSIPELPDHARLEEERGKENLARGNPVKVARNQSSANRTRTGFSTPAQSQAGASPATEAEPMGITSPTLAAVRKAFEELFGANALQRAVPYMQKHFGTNRLEDLTEQQGQSLLQNLRAAIEKRKAEAAAKASA